VKNLSLIPSSVQPMTSRGTPLNSEKIDVRQMATWGRLWGGNQYKLGGRERSQEAQYFSLLVDGWGGIRSRMGEGRARERLLECPVEGRGEVIIKKEQNTKGFLFSLGKGEIGSWEEVVPTSRRITVGV